MSEKLEQAIASIKAGNSNKGKQLLVEILKANPNNEQAWLWLSRIVVSKVDQRDFLKEVLRINPNNWQAKEALSELQTKRREEISIIIKSAFAGFGSSVVVLYLPHLLFLFVYKYVFNSAGDSLFLAMFYYPLILAGLLVAPIIGWIIGSLVYRELTSEDITSKSSRRTMVVSTLLFYLVGRRVTLLLIGLTFTVAH